MNVCITLNILEMKTSKKKYEAVCILGVQHEGCHQLTSCEMYNFVNNNYIFFFKFKHWIVALCLCIYTDNNISLAA